MKSHTTKLFLFLLMFSTALTSVGAHKNKNKIEPKVALLVPDKPANQYKSMPDTHPRSLHAPNFIAMTNTVNYLHGIDVSHYQHNINWKEASQDPKVGYVYIKATEGRDHVDATYDYNLREARRNGIKAGSYHFFRPNVSAAEQFRNFTKIINKNNQDLIPLIDVEVTGGVSVTTMHTCLQEFLQLITKEYGKKPLIYTGKNFYNKYFAPYSVYKSYSFMIAQYTNNEPVLNNNDDYLIWQYTGAGSVNGVRGHVDQSRFHGRHSINEILYK